jgi:hypothetical protein
MVESPERSLKAQKAVASHDTSHLPTNRKGREKIMS